MNDLSHSGIVLVWQIQSRSRREDWCTHYNPFIKLEGHGGAKELTIYFPQYFNNSTLNLLNYVSFPNLAPGSIVWMVIPWFRSRCIPPFHGTTLHTEVSCPLYLSFFSVSTCPLGWLPVTTLRFIIPSLLRRFRHFRRLRLRNCR